MEGIDMGVLGAGYQERLRTAASLVAGSAVSLLVARWGLLRGRWAEMSPRARASSLSFSVALVPGTYLVVRLWLDYLGTVGSAS